MYKNTRRPCHVPEKAYNCPVREIWAVSFVKDDGRVGAIPTYGVYRLYDNHSESKVGGVYYEYILFMVVMTSFQLL